MKRLLRSIVVKLLTWEARLVLRKYKPRIVGITASVGKSTTKEAIAAVLSSNFVTYRSPGSYNSEFGVPLTILGASSGWNNPLAWVRILLEGLGLIFFPNEYPEWLVLEMGIDHPGDMQRLASWVPLDIAVLGRVGDTPVHVEYFESPTYVALEKANIIKALKPDGIFIRLADDPVIAKFGVTGNRKLITYGYHKQADARATYERVQYRTQKGVKYPKGFSFKLDYAGEITPVLLEGVFGAAATYAALVGFVVGKQVGLPAAKCAEALKDFKGMPGRLRVLEGINNSVLLDDTYNSSPAAVALALGHLEQLKHAKRKIVVLGDMLELGTHSSQAHQEVGDLVGQVADLFYIIGSRMKAAKETAVAAGMSEDAIHVFSSPEEAGRALVAEVEQGDVVLLKASQSVRLEKATKILLAHPEEAEEMLVRQSTAWKDR